MTLFATASKSSRLYICPSAGLSATASRRTASSGLSSLCSTTTVDMSTGPRCLEASRYLSRVSGGWMGSNSSVASLPAYLRIILEPPGCSGGG